MSNVIDLNKYRRYRAFKERHPSLFISRSTGKVYGIHTESTVLQEDTVEVRKEKIDYLLAEIKKLCEE